MLNGPLKIVKKRNFSIDVFHNNKLQSYREPVQLERSDLPNYRYHQYPNLGRPE